MKLKRIAASLLIGAILIPAFAQDTTATQETDPSSDVHTLTWDKYQFSYSADFASDVLFYWRDRVSEGPYPAPASITFELSNFYGDMWLDRAALIRFYDAAEFQGEDWYGEAAATFKTLLDEHPDLSVYEGATTMGESLVGLPYLPTMNAAKVLIAQTEYVETDSFTGFGYIMIGRQSVGPFRADEPLYIFQGLSRDGSTYVSITIPLVTTVFPAEPEFEEMFDNGELINELESYLKDSFASIDAAAADQFTPNLDDIKALIRTITVK